MSDIKSAIKESKSKDLMDLADAIFLEFNVEPKEKSPYSNQYVSSGEIAEMIMKWAEGEV